MKRISHLLLKSGLLVVSLFVLHHSELFAQQAASPAKTKILISEEIRTEDGSILTSRMEKEGNFTEEEIQAIIDERRDKPAVIRREILIDKVAEDGTRESKQYHWKNNNDIRVLKRGSGPEDEIIFRLEDDKIRGYFPELRERMRDFRLTLPETEITIDDLLPRFRSEDFRFDFDNEGTARMLSNRKAFLGVYTEENDLKGVRITGLVDKSPATTYGLKAEDVILRVNETEIKSPDQLSREIGRYDAGAEVILTLLRDGQEIKQAVKLGTRQSQVAVLNMPRHRGEAEYRVPESYGPVDQLNWNKKSKGPRLGVTVEPMANYDGLKVTDVEEGSAASKGGIEVNDVIVKFDKVRVNDVKTLQSLVKDNAGNDVKIELQRNKKKKKVRVRID